MSNVKKYDSYGYDGLSGIMKEHPDGEWVRVENYELAVIERDAALAECERLRADAERWRLVEKASGYLTLRLHYSAPYHRKDIIDAALSAKP